jgi:hypothetical protein
MSDVIALERELLDFEESWTADRGLKAAEVRARFGLSLTKYYDELTRAANEPWAVVEYPSLASWLQRLAAERARFRVDAAD